MDLTELEQMYGSAGKESPKFCWFCTSYSPCFCESHAEVVRYLLARIRQLEG